MKIVKIFLVLLVICITSTANAASCWCTATAQESTQLANKLQLIKQLQEQVNMVAAQKQMIEKLSSGMASQLNGANTMILSQFDTLMKTLKDAKSLTHAMDDFMNKHNERHPEHPIGEQIDAQAERRRRDQQWKETLDAYLEALNMSARDLENRNKARQQLYDVLQSSQGQLQALQTLGAMINHTSMILEQNGQQTAGLITMFAQNEQDRRDKGTDSDQNMQLGFEEMKKLENKSPAHKFHLD